MILPPADPVYLILAIAGGLLTLVVSLLLIYLVIRLAITHGMLAYSHQLGEERRLPVHRE
ncbi:hypothetical protein GCM10022240_03740 [Microbacterium kribbense]|uniref:Uncharacterized protein n=1 Tax=Microbacterium kribbense TaxID=433645 RepID=A0ABP7G1Z9_9MICO